MQHAGPTAAGYAGHVIHQTLFPQAPLVDGHASHASRRELAEGGGGPEGCGGCSETAHTFFVVMFAVFLGI